MENRREKGSSPEGWGESCNEHQQNYLVKKNETWQQSQKKDYRSETHTIVMVQSQTGDKWESCLRSPKVCRNSPRYGMMLRVPQNLLMQEEVRSALEKVEKR